MSEEKFEVINTMKIIEADDIHGITRDETEALMTSANIPGAAIAKYQEGTILTMPSGSTTEEQSKSPTDIKPGTIFHVASLSKPVFAYLVLKLIEDNKDDTAKEGLGKFKSEFDLKTPLYSVFRDESGEILPDDKNPFLNKFNPEQNNLAKQLTAEMVLSHRTGLHITDKEPYKFQCDPGEHYAYSGPGIDCLQVAIKQLTGTDLETLAKENIFKPLEMPNSSFGPEPVAANSLKTSAEEYIKFITKWVNDERLNYAFNPVAPIYSMKHDFFPDSVDCPLEKVVIADSDKEQVTWGLGVGLVINNENQVIGAYHTGDMNEWRSGFATEIDPETKKCISSSIYLANSHNGHILAEHILPAALSPALNYFFPTYGFARSVSELDGTDFHGTNPKLLNPGLREKAYQTKVTTHHFKERLRKSKSMASKDPSEALTSTSCPLTITPKPN